MWESIKKMSLKKQLLLLFCITTVISLFVQVFYCLNIYWARVEEVRTSAYTSMRQTESSLGTVINQVKLAGKTVADAKDVQRYLLYKKGDESESIAGQFERMDFLQSFLGGIISANNMILDIALIDEKMGFLNYSRLFSYSAFYSLNQAYLLEERDDSFFTSWASIEWNIITPELHFAYVLPIRYTTGSFDDRNERLGYCVIWCKQSVLQDIVLDTAVTPNSYVAISDESGNPIAQSAQTQPGGETASVNELIETYQALTQGKEDIVQMDVGGIPCNVLIRENPENNWYSLSVTPVDEVYQSIMSVLYLGIILAVAGLAVMMIIGGLMIRNIAKPLEYITNSLKKVGESRGKYRLNDSSENEFGQISDAINSMLDETEQMNRRAFQMQTRLYETELMQKESEIMALQSQINPHFLYNTLECIRSIAMVRGVKEISVLTASMANIFRYSIKGGVQSTVEAERNCVLDYYKIVSIRYAGRLTMDVDISEELYPCQMIKMSLQPLIENSVNHGLEMTEEDVHVEVTGRREGDLAVFTVRDNGAGMAPERLEEVQAMLERNTGAASPASRQGNSIGLANIDGRIKLFYGSEFGLEVQSEETVGTTVQMKIPLDRA